MGLKIRHWCITPILLLLVVAVAHAAEEAAPATIAAWIADLNADEYAVREEATRQLQKAGKPAADAVIAAARGEEPEVALRALRILDTWSTSETSANVEVAGQAIADLAQSKHKFAGLAKNILQSRQERIIALFEGRGASVYLNDSFQATSVTFDGGEDLRDLHLLRELPELEHLSFSTEKFDDDGLAKLKGLSRLREINLFQSRIGDAGLAVFKTLPALRRVPMGQTRVTDKGLVHLKDLTNLEYIGLRGNEITDAGLENLKGLTNLTGLYLGETKVTDAGLVHLRGLTKLQMLYLDHTTVSDAGLEHLVGLTDLRDLYISDTRVTDEGIARLQKSLPALQLRERLP